VSPGGQRGHQASDGRAADSASPTQQSREPCPVGAWAKPHSLSGYKVVHVREMDFVVDPDFTVRAVFDAITNE
jgi:hypothetical protein